MIPAGFEYSCPTELEVALARLEAPHARALAGGQALVAAMKRRQVSPASVVDIGRLGLGGVRTEGDVLTIGATTTWADAAGEERIRAELPALADTAAVQGDRQVRNRATVGGGLAMADPRSDVWASAIALGARATLRSPGQRREVAAAEVFGAPFETTLRRGELITAVSFPRPGPAQVSAYRSIRHPASHFPMAGVTVRLELQAGVVTAPSVGLTAATTAPLRLESVERLLEGWDGTSDLLPFLREATAGLEIAADPVVDAEYRRHLVAVVVAEAAGLAFERARAVEGAR